MRRRRAGSHVRPDFALISAHALNNPMIKEGDPAPDFDLETDEGTRVSLSSLKGRNVVLFFYPKDNTSG
jgi:peroxiredoxin